MGKLGVALNRGHSNCLAASLVGDGLHGNNIFDLGSSGNRDGCFEPYVLLRKMFLKHGVELNTADVNPGEQLRFELHMDAQQGYSGRNPAFAVLYEAPQIKSHNQKLSLLARYRRVFTWRDDLTDGQKYIQIHLPNKILVNNSRGWGGRHKLCCMIASNKAAARDSPLLLYSERVAVIRWFEQHAPHDFDLFGVGWDRPAASSRLVSKAISKLRNFAPVHPDEVFFPSYRGKVISKFDTFQNYRFSICYENVQKLPGYITEKIFDSFSGGCVPVYWGASNINVYVPEDCFIDRRKFASNSELHTFLASMTESKYTAYQERIAAFQSSGRAQPFSAETFAATIVNTIVSDLGIEA